MYALLLLLLLQFIFCEHNDKVFKVMTYNVRCADDILRYEKDGSIVTRAPRVMRNILAKNPDSIGFQEVTTTQGSSTAEWFGLLRLLLYKNYKGFGSGRNEDHTGEANPIFYNTNALELVESGTKWLSPTPDVPGSKFEDTPDHPTDGLPRIMTYGIFKRKADKITYMHINTHLDYKCYQNRVSQIKVVYQFIKKYENKYPIILTGDFNSGSKNPKDAVPYLLNNGYTNSQNEAKSVIKHWTYPTIDYINNIFGTCKKRGYHYIGVSINKQKYCDKYCDEENSKTIDFILKRSISPIIFTKYEAMTDITVSNGISSDHYPIYVEGQFSSRIQGLKLLDH